MMEERDWLARLSTLSRYSWTGQKPIPKEEIERAAEAIATLLHDTLCSYDHTEGCAWKYDEGHAKDPGSYYYKSDIWEMDCHRSWKHRALRAMATVYRSDKEFPGK